MSATNQLGHKHSTMDHQLLESALMYHGTFLLDQLRAEQQSSVDGGVTSYLHSVLPHSDEPRDDCDHHLVKFIAKKADLLFAVTDKESLWKPDVRNRNRYCAVLPPVEYFMEVSRTSQRQQLFCCLDRGDVIIGSVSALHDMGLMLTLLAVDVGMARDIAQLKITALCPLREIPKSHAHENALEAFAIKDKIRAVVINVADEKITVSLQPRALLHDTAFHLGLITDEDMPAYFRSLESTAGRSYGMLLRDAPEFRNPSDVSNMAVICGLDSVKCQPSLMRGLYRVKYDEADFADRLRKEQSRRLAMRSVAEGVEHFKNSRLPEAMQMFNKALQIDSENVEALVARGALYANSESYRRALEDFDAALACNPDHTNARKYTCDTLLALTRSQLESGDVNGAISHVYRASLLYPNNPETVSLLAEIQRCKVAEMAEEMMAKHSGPAGESPPNARSREALSKHKQKDSTLKESSISPGAIHKAKKRLRSQSWTRKHNQSSSTSSSSSLTSSGSSLPMELSWVPAPAADNVNSLSQLVGCRAKFGDHRGYDVTLVNPERRTSSTDGNTLATFGPSLPPLKTTETDDCNQKSSKGSVSREQYKNHKQSPSETKNNRSTIRLSPDGKHRRSLPSSSCSPSSQTRRKKLSEQYRRSYEQSLQTSTSRRRKHSTSSNTSSDSSHFEKSRKISKSMCRKRHRNSETTVEVFPLKVSDGKHNQVKSDKSDEIVRHHITSRKEKCRKSSESSESSSSVECKKQVSCQKEKNRLRHQSSRTYTNEEVNLKRINRVQLLVDKRSVSKSSKLKSTRCLTLPEEMSHSPHSKLSSGKWNRHFSQLQCRSDLHGQSSGSSSDDEKFKTLNTGHQQKMPSVPASSKVKPNVQRPIERSDNNAKETLEDMELFLKQLKANKQLQKK